MHFLKDNFRILEYWLLLFFLNFILKKEKFCNWSVYFVILDLFIENGQKIKAESYKIKIYNQFYSLKLFYLKTITFCKCPMNEAHLHRVSVSIYKFMAFLNLSKNSCKSWRKIKYVNVKIIIRPYKITGLMFKEIKSIKMTIFCLKIIKIANNHVKSRDFTY